MTHMLKRREKEPTHLRPFMLTDGLRIYAEGGYVESLSCHGPGDVVVNGIPVPVELLERGWFVIEAGGGVR